MDAETTLGVKEQLIFPEINFDDVGKLTWFGYRNRNYSEHRRRMRALLTGLSIPV